MTRADKMSFKVMCFVHETLYGLFRNPYKALKAAGIQAGQLVLEVGCGPGFFTIPAAEIIGEAGKIIAIDINPLALELVQKKIKINQVINASTILADIAKTRLPNQYFDLVFVFGFIRPIGDLNAIWLELHRLLKPAGILSTEGRCRPTARHFQPVKHQGRIAQFTKIG
jgi:demethylmenaquinone methyltransferase/2-methoxy-6-polyprenyl-1,4-benzoquinol methylase